MNQFPLPWQRRIAQAALPLGVAGLLGLLALLGSMQYRWLAEVKHAELSRRRAMAQARADAFARDLDHELGRLVVLLSLDQGALDAGRFGELGDRLRAWRAESPLRGLLEDVWLARGVGGSVPPSAELFDEQTDRFVAHDWPADLGRVRDRLAAGASERGAAGVQPDAPALLMPVLPLPGTTANAPPGPGQPQSRFAFHLVTGASPPDTWVVLRFDVEALRGAILPELARRHFGSEDGAEYHLSVVRSVDPAGLGAEPPAGLATGFTPGASRPTGLGAEPPAGLATGFTPGASRPTTDPLYVTPGAPRASGPADVEAPLFSARFDDVDGAVLAHLTARRVMTARAEASSSREVGQPRSPRNMFVVRMGGQLGSPGASAWRLRVTHREGSLEAAVSGAQRRQAATAAGIMVVLAGSVALLALSQRRASALLAQQAEFVAGVSHELRTPLAVIRSAAENLRDGVVSGPEQTKRYGETLADEGHRLSEMVEQLLEFAGADAPERALRRVPLALPPLLEQAARQAQCEAAGVVVEWRLAPGLPAVVGEAPALLRVFTNLLANAVRHGLGRAVAVEASAEGGRARVAVRDQGPGLGDADRGRLFEPFYRGARAIEQQVPGSGLGLSVVRRIVVAHGGRIRAGDAPGGGAVFTVELDVAPAEAASASAAEPLRARS